MVNGEPVTVQETGDKMLVELYRRYAGNYPKFFKMDTLSRLGFIAAEILLGQPADQGQPQVQTVILANRSASIKNDTDYQATISNTARKRKGAEGYSLKSLYLQGFREFR